MKKALQRAAAILALATLAGQAGAARIDPADYGLQIEATESFRGVTFFSQSGGFFGFADSGASNAILVIDGLAPFAASDFSVFVASPLGNIAASAADVLGIDAAGLTAGFDLLFTAEPIATTLPGLAGRRFLASLDFSDLTVFAEGEFLGSASVDLSLLASAGLQPIPLPAGGLLLVTAAGALVALRRRRTL